MFSLRSIARPVSSATSSRTVARTAAPIISQRWNSTSSDTKAEEVNKAADKVESAAEEVTKKVQELEAQVKELKSQLTYGKADFINLQRRSETEKVSARDFAIQGFAADLLGTVDILTTALKYVPQPIPAENTGLTALFSGVQMTRSELLKTLARHGVTEFDPTGEKFDPNVHEAMFQAPIPGKEPGSVLECQKTGFMLKTRCLRPAQVGVVQDTSS